MKLSNNFLLLARSTHASGGALIDSDPWCRFSFDCKEIFLGKSFAKFSDKEIVILYILMFKYCACAVLKVSKSRKQFMVSSILPKKNEKKINLRYHSMDGVVLGWCKV